MFLKIAPSLKYLKFVNIVEQMMKTYQTFSIDIQTFYDFQQITNLEKENRSALITTWIKDYNDKWLRENPQTDGKQHHRNGVVVN